MEFVGGNKPSASAAFPLVRLDIDVHILFACLRIGCGDILNSRNSSVSVGYDAS